MLCPNAASQCNVAAKRIGVDQQRVFPDSAKARGQRHCRRRGANAALPAGDRQQGRASCGSRRVHSAVHRRQSSKIVRLIQHETKNKGYRKSSLPPEEAKPR
jgi:hypothetical protein